MSLKSPKIDKRNYDEIVTQTIKLAEHYSRWKLDANGNPDAGKALIRIFGRMASLVSDRINQAPEKHFLAFLDLIGTQLLAPQPSIVPLTFNLVVGSPNDALVPAYTQIAAPAVDGGEEIVFETDSELVVTTSQLQAVFVREPGEDKYKDCILEATGQNDADFAAFIGEKDIEHFLYIACDDLFSIPVDKTITVNLDLDNSGELTKLLGDWYYWDEEWKKASHQNDNKNKLTNLPFLELQKVNNLEARWLRVKINNTENQSKINDITVTANIAKPSIKPEISLFNSTAIDLNKDFYPFGEQPKFNDTFYIAIEENFAQPGVKVTVDINLSEGIPVKDGGIQIAWEVWNGDEWLRIIVDNNQQVAKFLNSGNFEITLPEKVQKTKVNEEEKYWVRARIIAGNYGEPVYGNTALYTRIIDKTGTNSNKIKVASVRGFMPGDKIQITWDSNSSESNQIKTVDIKNNTLTLNNNLKNAYNNGALVILQNSNLGYQPPSIKSLTLSYNYQTTSKLSACLTYNNFQYRNHLNDELQPFQPFISTSDTEATLYLGFDKPFDNRLTTLYAQVQPPSPGEVTPEKNTNINQPIQLAWEYYSNDSWKSLVIEDGTNNFEKRGLIRFVGAKDFSQHEEFHQSLYWLRIRWTKGVFRIHPRLKRLLTNTIWASQAVTLKNEILGSSNGNPNQSFYTIESPVLQNQQLEIRENLSPQEIEIIQNTKGKEALNIIRNDMGDIEETWVRWKEVGDFYASQQRDRNYVIDRNTGKIQFGDGQLGMIPPQGTNNIRMTVYRHGGGEQGNKPALSITQLKTTIPYVESVTNYEPAGAGADIESIERVKQRGATILRHRGKAVTQQDFEDLAYEASSDIAKAKVITQEFNPLDDDLWLDSNSSLITGNDKHKARGEIKLLIVPKSDVLQPTPDLALIDRVKEYITARCLSTFELQVSGPYWIKVSVTANIVPVSSEVADAAKSISTKSITEFLHPLAGAYGKGWRFGHQPQKSDLYALLASISQVKYVDSLDIKFSNTSDSILSSNSSLIYSGEHEVQLTVNS